MIFSIILWRQAPLRCRCNTVPIGKGTETLLRATARLDLNLGSRSVIWIKLVGGASASS
jgi:hypothetical protein